MSANIVRAAIIEDASAVEECVVAAFEPYVERIGKPPAPMIADYPSLIRSERVWVAERDGEVAGVLVQYVTEHGFYLDTVAVSPSWRGTGVGRALLQFAENQAIHCGFDSIYLCTNTKMTENQILYPKIGYTEYDRRAEAGYDRVFYRKQLDTKRED